MMEEMGYGGRKVELENKIKALEDERSSLLTEISSLREKVIVIRLEGQTKALEYEVATLKAEKSSLEEELSNISPPAAAETVTPPTESQVAS